MDFLFCPTHFFLVEGSAATVQHTCLESTQCFILICFQHPVLLFFSAPSASFAFFQHQFFCLGHEHFQHSVLFLWLGHEHMQHAMLLFVCMILASNGMHRCFKWAAISVPNGTCRQLTCRAYSQGYHIYNRDSQKIAKSASTNSCWPWSLL